MIVIKKCDGQMLYNVNIADQEKIENALTFNNPKYTQAKRYSRSGYTSVPKYITFYHRYKDHIKVPIGINIPELLERECDIKDLRSDVIVKYPPFKMTLREDQETAKQSYMSEQTKEYPKSLIHLPTGKGKTVLALNIAYELKQRTLILVHKDDLVVGWKKDIEDAFGGKVGVGLIKAQSRTIGKHFTIATVQTISKMSKDELEGYVNQFGLVIQDECHHIGLNMFNIIDQFNSKYKLGLSATPVRKDGLSFTFDLFLGGMCYVHKYTQEDDDIMSVKVEKRNTKAMFVPFVYEGAIYNVADFSKEELPTDLVLLKDLPYEDRPKITYAEIDNSVVLSTIYKIQVCKDVLTHYKKGNSCLLLFQYKDQIRSYYSYLKRYIPSDKILLYYGDSKEKVNDMIEKAESKECLVTLATFAKATEGTNVKAWEVEFLVSSINNEKNVEQAVGRIRRKKKGKIDPVILYDYRSPDVYTFGSHGLTRDKTYRKLKLIVDKKVKARYTRGYKY